MLTICWAAKGGSGTTVYAAARAVTSPQPTLLVDLAGDAMAALGLPDPDGPGVYDWLRSDSGADRLGALELPAGARLDVLPSGRHDPSDGIDPACASRHERWGQLAARLAADVRPVIVDAGTGVPPPALLAVATERLLVIRPCYLSLRRAAAAGVSPSGVVLVDEPGRRLAAADVEASVGAPVVSTVLLDPAIARAVDAGLLVSRLPGSWRRRLQRAA